VKPGGIMIAAVAAALAFNAQARAETMTMLSSWDESYNAVPVFAQGFADRMSEKTDGEISIELRGPESVPPFEQLQPVATGLFDMLFTHGAYHLGETAMAFAMDAVADDPVARRESGLYEAIDEHYQARGLKLIGVFSAASGYHLLLSDPIGDDGALEGRRIRASATYHDFITELGGSVVTLPAGEIYSALDRGVVDGAAWPVFGALDYGWYEVSNYMTRPMFGVTNLTLFINLDKWNALDPEIQEAMIETAKELEIEGREHFKTLWADEDAEMQARGLEITEFGPEVAPRVDAIFATGVWKQVEESAGEEGRALRELAVEHGLTAE
jgi:TRAP-type transport system periplasmic protein